MKNAPCHTLCYLCEIKARAKFFFEGLLMLMAVPEKTNLKNFQLISVSKELKCLNTMQVQCKCYIRVMKVLCKCCAIAMQVISKCYVLYTLHLPCNYTTLAILLSLQHCTVHLPLLHNCYTKHHILVCLCLSLYTELINTIDISRNISHH